MAPFPGACGRGCAPVPNPMWGRGLSERSEFRSPKLREWGKGTPPGATPGRQWFGVLLPKQKGPRRAGPKPREPLCVPENSPSKWGVLWEEEAASAASASVPTSVSEAGIVAPDGDDGVLVVVENGDAGLIGGIRTQRDER